MPFCTNCGKEVPTAATFCPNCGKPTTAQTWQQPTPPPYYRQPPRKDPGLAAVLAIIGAFIGLPGIGHIYVGRIGRGLLILFSGLILLIVWVMIFFLSIIGGPGAILGALGIGLVFIIVYIVIVIWQIFDAYNLAKRYNQVAESTGREPW